ncbi:hypothetical protein AC579_10269 [Pseudocercospora musae]|uniref:DUF7703 domain-containing protein n=1 Tax=Pseudocercospora musae TaxID=113226 RepID=A0A139I5J2_9PEZI|nr:hypothetical protein AC579_10269 [Pseudocercospora musae]
MNIPYPRPYFYKTIAKRRRRGVVLSVSVMPSNSSASASWTSAGAGITGGYDGNSDTLRYLIVFFCALAMYNACELVVMVCLTFTHFHGLYFASLLVSGVAIIPYSLGFLLKFMMITTGKAQWLAVVLLTLGWYPMVTGQAVVLWSRLHLLVTGTKGDRILFWTKCMIVTNAVCLHVPTTVLTFGANGSVNTRVFETGYNIMEKIQMIGFFLQDLILSSIYIVETVRILRTSLQPGTRKTMKQLIFINLVIILMDLGLLGLECASLYILETLLKGVIYSIKLKLEFAILSKLVKFVRSSSVPPAPQQDMRKASIGFVTTHGEPDRHMNIQDFVDLHRISTDITHPPQSRTCSDSMASRRRSARHPSANLELDLARFEHIEDVSSLGEVSSRSSRSPVPRGEV